MVLTKSYFVIQSCGGLEGPVCQNDLLDLTCVWCKEIFIASKTASYSDKSFDGSK